MPTPIASSRTVRTVVALLTTLLLSGQLPAPATAADVPQASAPADAESLGIPLQDVQVIGGTSFTAPDGTPRLFTTTLGDPARLIGINPSTGQKLVDQPLPGASSSYSVIATGNGDVYVSTNPNGGLYRLADGSSTVEFLGRAVAGETFAWDITEGPDGRIYGTTFPSAKMYAYDPAGNTFQDCGRVAGDTQQGRAIASYGGSLYAGTMTPAHLLKIDPATGAKHEVPLPAAADPANPLTSIFDINAVGDRLYVRIGTDIKHSPLYQLDPATEQWGASLDGVAGLELPDAGPDGGLYVMRDSTLTRWDPATGATSATPVRGEQRVYNYRGVGWVDLGDPAWPGRTLVGFLWRGSVFRYNPQTGRSDVSQADVPGTPIDILSLEGAEDGGIWAGGYLGGFAHVDPSSGATSFHRFSQTERIRTDNGKLLLGAYPDARGYSYDPSLPFNDPDYSPGPPGAARNPAKLWDSTAHPQDPQDRVFDLSPLGTDLLLGTTGPKASSYGGSLVVTDRATGAADFVDNVSTDRALTSIAPGAGGVVYLGTWIWGGTGSPEPPPRTDGTVVAYDVRARRKLWESVPVPGAPSVVGVTMTRSGHLWALAGAKLLELNPVDGSIIRTVALDTTVSNARTTWPFQRGVVEPVAGSDALHVSAGGRLFLVYEKTGYAQPLGDFPYSNFAPLTDGSLAMAKGSELFHWTPPAPDTAAPEPAIRAEQQAVVMDATDAGGSGLDTVVLRVDGGAWTPYSSPVKVRPGRHVVAGRATDHAGNTATTSRVLIVHPVLPGDDPLGGDR